MPHNPTSQTVDLLVIGHVTEDLLDGQAALGGSATYASLTARNLGAQVGLLTSAGWEPDLVDLLRGIYVARVCSEESTCFRNRYAGGRREQWISSLAQPLTSEYLLPAWRTPPIVLLAPVAQEVEPRMVNAFPDALVAVSLQGWLRGWDRKGRVRQVPLRHAAQVLPRTAVAFLSEEDLPDRKLLERYASLAPLLVITAADQGARVYQAGRVSHSPAFKPEQCADPTGAGDVFAAAFVLKLHETANPEYSADYANCVASFAVEQPGAAGIPTAEQVDGRWRSGERLVSR